MGTRSTTLVYEGATPLVCMYRQMDGYPFGHGQELARFLKPIKVINGFGMDRTLGKEANGMACLAAQMVGHFKKELGGIYLKSLTEYHDQDYEYHIHSDKVVIFTDLTGSNKPIFSGTWDEFYDYCSTKK